MTLARIVLTGITIAVTGTTILPVAHDLENKAWEVYARQQAQQVAVAQNTYAGLNFENNGEQWRYTTLTDESSPIAQQGLLPASSKNEQGLRDYCSIPTAEGTGFEIFVKTGSGRVLHQINTEEASYGTDTGCLSN